MSVIYRADHVPASSQEDYWRHALAEALGRLDPLGYPDRVLVGEVGAVRVGDLTASGQGGARRRAAHISSSDPDFCKIDVLAAGRGVVEQGGREAQLRPGDLTFVDLLRPATWNMSGSMRVVAVLFPRALLPLRHDELARMTGVRIGGERGAGALVSSLARQLPEHLDHYGATDGTRLGTAVLDMVTAVLAAHLDRSDQVPPESRQRALLRRVHAFMRSGWATRG